MNFKGIFWLILLVSLIISLGFVSAADVNDTTIDIVTQSSEIDLTDINEEDNLEISLENQISSQDDSRVIYVGQNKTTDGGNGTPDNPFNSFELACNNLSGENKVEINVYNGTYYLNSDLKFNTSNLFINGIGQVIIKNLENKEGAYASFGLTSSFGNFTFSNLIFDGSNCTYDLYNLILNRYFYIFKGNANLGILNNCTFTGFNNNVMFSNQFNRKFICCNFLDTYNYISNTYWYDGLIIDFEYCVISNGIYLGQVPIARNPRLNLTYNNVWLGSNSINEYLYYDTLTSSMTYTEAKSNLIRYAIFSASENYLGNNTYEIIGKLTWNDNTTDGIEMLHPLTVKFSSRSGEIQKTTILENGFFKVIYKSKSENNEIDIDLDSQEIILEFKNGIQAICNPINFGDEQIVTVILPQAINTIVNITINNKTYEVPTNGLSKFNFTVPDELLADSYQVDVKITDIENHIYGFDSTNWTISKINKDIIVTTPANININDESINLTVLLERGVTGNITVCNGDKNITKECFGRNVQIDISSILNVGENNIKVIYSGNKKYSNQTKSYKIFVNKVYPNINITKPINASWGDGISIIISIPPNASGNLTVFGGDKNIIIGDLSDRNIVDVSDLIVVGYNVFSVSYSGDDWWDSQIKKETLYVNKSTPRMSVNLTQSTVQIGDNLTLQIILPQDSNGDLIVKNDEEYLFKVNGEITSVKVPCLYSGVNYINVTYCGNDKYYSHSQVLEVFVDKLNVSSDEIKIVVTNHTVPAVSIDSLINLTGNVTMLVNGDVYVQTLINGSVFFKIEDLMPGEYNATVVYSGNDEFNVFSKTVEFSVPKPVLKANDVNMLYKSGSKYAVYVTAGGSPVIGKKITFTINGKKTTAFTNNKGYASVKIDLPPKSKKYTVTAQYRGVKIINKVKINSIILAKNLKVKKSAKTFKIKVTIKKVNGKYLKCKKIILKFKGKKYVSKTNKKGVATFKLNKNVLKNLKAGKNYKYQVCYLKNTISKKITVKK